MKIGESGLVSAKIASNSPKASTSAEKRRNPANVKLAKEKKIELKRADAEQLKISIIDAMADGLALVDMDGEVISVNPAMEKMSGYSRSELVGKNAFDLLKKTAKPEDLERVAKAVKTGLNGKVATPFVAFTLVSKDGREVPVSCSASFIKDAKGKPVNAIVTIKNITELKRAEERRIKAEVMAEAVRERATVIDSMADGLVLVDMDGKITSVNPAMEKMGGYSKSEIVGKDAVDIISKVVKTEDKEKIIGALRTALEGKVSSHETFTFITKDGQEVSVISTTSFMKDAEGKPSTMILVFKDITEQKRMEEEIRNAEEEKLKAKKQRIEELEKLTEVAVGRELEMIELRQRIRALELKLKEITGK